jgi:ADP-heptose:LPS heptosyltransferase
VGYSLRPQDRFVIHPGAGKEPNRWPSEPFLELINRLGEHVRVLLGEAEIERWPGALLSQFESACEVHRPATLLELLDEIASAKGFVGNDSGPTHLAGILGVPTVALFGPSDPTRWRPLGPRVKVLHSQPIEAISVESVYTELTRCTRVE